MWNVITLDGYFEGEKPWDLAFHSLVWGEELEQFSREQLDTADMVIYGKHTYQGMAEYWKKETGEIADRLNTMQKIVCSTTIQTADWANTTIVRDAESEIAKLKKEGSGNLFVFGGSVLSAALMKAGLFDEYRLCIAPVFLGRGRKLFAEGAPYQKLNLREEKTLKTGGVLVKYAVT